jgi:hypothetical protein
MHLMASGMCLHHGRAVPIVSLSGGFESKYAYKGGDKDLLEWDVEGGRMHPEYTIP